MSTYCKRCGIKLKDGDLRYLVTIHVTADFDGKMPSDGDIDDLEAFMLRIDEKKQLKPQSEQDHDVYQSKGFVLCKVCKTDFMHNPIGEPVDEDSGAEPGEKPDEEGRIH